VSPLVSVVIPAYNVALYLRQALDSVLAQTFRDIEIVVVDDGSKDDTARILGEYASLVQVIRQDNAGVSLARNRGIAATRGRYVAFLDADDVWYPSKIERQLAALSKDGRWGAAYTGIVAVDQDLRPAAFRGQPRPRARLEDLLFLGNVIGAPSTVLCERSLLDKVGGFDPAFSLCADWDLWIRLATATAFAHVDEPLVLYRRHAGNMSREVPVLEDESVRLLLKAFGQASLPEPLRKRRAEALGRNQMMLAGSYYRLGAYGSACRCGLAALRQEWRQGGRLLAFPWRALRRRLRGEMASDF
jgi:glycosyltransferase involved in cell wall biosynthesis